MNAKWTRSSFLLLALLCLGSQSESPENEEEEETDPELTAGYFQGDMDVPLSRSGVPREIVPWPNATVYYVIDEDFSCLQIRHIYRAMEEIQAVTCIKFEAVSETSTNYVKIIPAEIGCSSNVGFLDRVQYVRLKHFPIDSGCFILGKIEHELLHTLGITHQHSRMDRESYVSVLWSNIRADRVRNFDVEPSNAFAYQNVGYDYGSIMHYPVNAFAIDPSQQTLKSLVVGGDLKMGQRVQLSQADIDVINKMYNCP